jgi:hypothetical protein
MLTQAEINAYRSLYPAFTHESVVNCLGKIKAQHGRLDAITVDYHLRGQEVGGLGEGQTN